jgi:peptide/nickel transport system ATP-binding protein
MPEILRLDELAVSYFGRGGETRVIPGLSFALAEGDSYGLVGESGCGKSTVAMSVMRHLGASGRIVGGRVVFRGRDMATLSPRELRALRGSGVAMVYQEPAAALNPAMTIGHQLTEIPMWHERVGRAEARRRAVAMLREVRVPDPELMLSRYPHQVSGGQQQRVVIAMALLSNPSLLLLDEPTTGLDVTVEAAVVDLIADLRRRFGTTLLYISHNLGLIAKVCDRVGVMYAGELVEEAPVDELFRAPRHPYTRALLACLPRLGGDKHTNPLAALPGQVATLRHRPQGCVFAPRCALARAACRTGTVPADMEGERVVRCHFWREAATVQGPTPIVVPSPSADADVLRIDRLVKVYGGHGLLGSGRGVRALDGISLAASRAGTLAIVGESGCGKSTLAKVLAGLERGSEGSVVFDGRDIARLGVAQRPRELLRAIQMVFQNPDGTLNPSRSIGSAIGRVIAKLHGTRGAALKQEVRKLLALVRLPPDIAARKPRQLSGGQKQRVAIARAFAGEPDLVIADEPVAALDVSVQAAIINLFLEIQARRGATLVFISHDLGLVHHIADRVVVMYLGRVMESGPVGRVFDPPYHPYTEALLSAIPVVDPEIRQKPIRLSGEPPSAVNRPAGCAFAGRCPRKLGAICDTTPPPEHDAGEGHVIACHIPLDVLRGIEPVFARAREPAAARA